MVSCDLHARRGLRGNREYLSKYPETKRIYLNNGKFYNEGDVFMQPDLAATFARLQQRGQRILQGRRPVDRGRYETYNGLLTLEDLRAMSPKNASLCGAIIAVTK